MYEQFSLIHRFTYLKHVEKCNALRLFQNLPFLPLYFHFLHVHGLSLLPRVEQFGNCVIALHSPY